MAFVTCISRQLLIKVCFILLDFSCSMQNQWTLDVMACAVISMCLLILSHYQTLVF